MAILFPHAASRPFRSVSPTAGLRGRTGWEGEATKNLPSKFLCALNHVPRFTPCFHTPAPIPPVAAGCMQFLGTARGVQHRSTKAAAGIVTLAKGILPDAPSSRVSGFGIQMGQCKDEESPLLARQKQGGLE